MASISGESELWYNAIEDILTPQRQQWFVGEDRKMEAGKTAC